MTEPQTPAGRALLRLLSAPRIPDLDYIDLKERIRAIEAAWPDTPEAVERLAAVLDDLAVYAAHEVAIRALAALREQPK